MSEAQSTWTLDDAASASNPGNLDVSPFRWFRHYPKGPLIWFGSFLFFVALAWLVHWSFWIVALLLLAMNVFYWQRIRDHCRHGDTNPAMVVSLDPMLIAVSTDLTKGIGNYPVVKIIEKSLPTVYGQVPQVGSRLAVVSLYAEGTDESLPHWIDFDPRPIECVTKDPNAIQAVMNIFTADDWNDLESGLKQVPRPFRCGLFHVQADVLRPESSG